MSFHESVRRFFTRPSPPRRRADDTLFRSMVEQSGDMICHLVDRVFVYVSPSAREIFGWEPEAIVGTTGMKLIHSADLPVLADIFAREESGEFGLNRHQVRVICGDGSIKWAETTAHAERAETGKTRTILVIRDITERKAMEQQLEELARKDGLTGLANRRHFDEMIERTWRRTLREGSEMALLLLDIDHFKQFNDAYGHQAGDDCLRAVASTISKVARRADDVVCRYGGEEFAVILAAAGPDTAVAIAEDIRRAVANLAIPQAADSDAEHLTVSIGAATAVARIGGSVRMPETLLQAADHALYKAKAAGRDRVERSVLIAPSERE